VDAHADQWAVGAAAVENRIGMGVSDLFEALGMAEVRRGRSWASTGTGTDEPGVLAVLGDAGDQPAVHEQAQSVQRHGVRAAPRLQRAGVPGRQHIDRSNTEVDGVGDGRAPRDTAVDEPTFTVPDRR
jgi:hypothetical protein